MNTESTRDRVNEFERLRASAGRWRIATSIVTAVVTTGCLAYLYHSATSLVREGPERNAFVAEFENGLSTQVAPQVKDIALQTWNQLRPAVQSEVVRVQSRAPEIAEALRQELELFEVNLPARAEKVLDASVGDMLRQREAKIRAMCPEATPEKLAIVVGLLKDEGERRMGNVAEKLVTPYEHTLQQMVDDLAAIHASEEEYLTGQTAAEDMAVLVTQLVHEDIHKVQPALEKSIGRE